MYIDTKYKVFKGNPASVSFTLLINGHGNGIVVDVSILMEEKAEAFIFKKFA